MVTICRIPRDWQQHADSLHAPEAPQPYYDMTQLPDPPKDKVFWATKKREVYNAFKKPMIDALEKHYLWGIRAYEYPGKPTKTEKIDALWKYFYYMSKDHMPQRWEEVIDMNRDGGPRLLRWNLNPTPAPVSIFYPELPPTSSQSLDAKQDWYMPPDAPPNMPRTFVLQFQFSSVSPEQQPWAAIPGEGSENVGNTPANIRPTPPSRQRKTNESLHLSSPSSAAPTSHTFTRSPYGQSFSGQGPPGMDPSVLSGYEEVFQMSGYEEDFGMSGFEENTGVSGFAGEDSGGPPGGSDPQHTLPAAAFDETPIRELIEKAIMKYTYRWLDRHPGAPSKGPIAYRIAEKAEDLAIVQSGAFSSVQGAKINLNLQLDPGGFAVPVRGRGPIWEGTSCAIDCAIVLGSLLDAGCTLADRGTNDGAHFSDLEKAFVEVTNMNWEAFSDETSKELRNSFHRLLCKHIPSITTDNRCHSWVPWSECTKNFVQFRFDYTTVTQLCHCKGSGVVETAGNGRVLDPASLPGDRDGVNVGQLWARSFPIYHPLYCPDCAAGPENYGPSLYRKITNLPLRLVVQTEPNTKIWQHTQDQVFDYINERGEMCQVAYRWLGGIYGSGVHGRVFWSESKRFEAPTKDYAMYDGALASGMIVALPSCGDEENIPLEWVHDLHCPPILVYERIMNPEVPSMITAMNTVRELGQWVEESRLFKYHHIPWTPEPGPLFNFRERQLPSFGDRFLDSKRPDPFDTLPDDIWDIKIPDWVTLAKIDPGRNLVSKYGLPAVDSVSQIPPIDLLGTPPPLVPEDVSPFDSPHVGPQSLARRPELWPAGSLDITGALDFPSLLSQSSSRSFSGSSSGTSSPGGRRPYTLREYVSLQSAPNQGPEEEQDAQMQGGDTLMQETGGLTAEEELLFKEFTHIAGFHSGIASPPPLYNLYARKRKRAMREQVLIENAKKVTRATKVTKEVKVMNFSEKEKNKNGALGKDATSKKRRAETDERLSKPKAKAVKFA